MTVRLTIFSAFVLLVSVSCAQANWRYTKWGMTPEQFAQASRGAAGVVPLDPQESIKNLGCLVRGTYESGSQSFVLSGYFDSHGLELVILSFPGQASSQDANAIISSLSAKYGTAITAEVAPIPVTMWTDARDGNQIQVVDMTSSIRQLEIRYMPLRTGDGL